MRTLAYSGAALAAFAAIGYGWMALTADPSVSTATAGNPPPVAWPKDPDPEEALGRDGDRILVFDTAVGLIRCTREWFAGRYEWKGTALIFGSTPPGLLVRAYGPPVALIAVGVAVLGWIARPLVRRGRPRAEPR